MAVSAPTSSRDHATNATAARSERRRHAATLRRTDSSSNGGGGTLGTPRLRCHRRFAPRNTEWRRTCTRELARSFHHIRRRPRPARCRRSPREPVARVPVRSMGLVPEGQARSLAPGSRRAASTSGMCSSPSSITQCGTAAPSVSTTTFHATLNASSRSHGRQRERLAEGTYSSSANLRETQPRLMAMNNVSRYRQRQRPRDGAVTKRLITRASRGASSPQRPHCENASCWADGERHVRQLPTPQIDPDRHESNRHNRQQESDDTSGA